MSRAPDLAEWLDSFLRDRAFAERYPYYVAILGKLAPVADPSVQRMAVSLFEGRFFLHVNVEAFVKEPQYLRGVLLHEVHHIALGHLAHPKFGEADEPELMDLALEMSANEYIEEPLPSPIVWSTYSALGIRAGQSTVERYHRLMDARRGQREAQKEGASGRENKGEAVDDHRFLRVRKGAHDQGAVEHTRNLLQTAIEGAHSEKSRGDEDPKRQLLAGKDPGRLIEELTGTLGPAATFVDWKSALRMFVARARAPVHTWSRPSRRFPAQVGVVPGRTYAPRAVVRPSLLVVIDTSMSMSARELDEIARQLVAMADCARITVVECDTEITRTYAFTGSIEDVAGRGGTDLRPVFEPSFLASRRADGVVYFTDGDGPFPAQPPPIQVLWILTKPVEFACPWGERARLLRRDAPAAKAPPKRAPRGQRPPKL